MLTINPTYITDNSGRKISVVLPIKEFTTIMEEMEELDDIRLFDKVKKENKGKRVLFSEYLKKRERNIKRLKGELFLQRFLFLLIHEIKTSII